MKSDWQQRPEAGNPRVTLWFARVALAIGPRMAGWLLRPISGYFYLVRPDERRASRAYLERILDHPVRRRDVLRHFYVFSQVVLDRLFILGRGGRGIDIEMEGIEALVEALDENRGCLLMGSHLGSFEASRFVKLQRPDVQLKIVMNRAQNPATTGILESLNPELAASVLDVSSTTAVGLKILEALEEKAAVALLADRSGSDEGTVEASFLGDLAQFPNGTHQIALLTQAPTVLFWGLHVGPRRYRVVFERFANPEQVPRGERASEVAASVQRYADRLEHHVRQAPYNWFNFYDFWH